jgi:membrane protein CcdC involved in cytochrome C biogenesis
MSTEAHQDSAEPHEEQLCTSCAARNEPSADFCVKCGAPLSSFSMIAPFERLFAEGFIYRQAADRPRNLVTVIGVWFIFGMMALGSLIFMVAIFQSTGDGLVATIIATVFGTALLAFSIAMIWKTTRNYLTRNEIDHKTDA